MNRNGEKTRKKAINNQPGSEIFRFFNKLYFQVGGLNGDRFETFTFMVIQGYSKLLRPLERKKGKSWGLIDEYPSKYNI